MNRASRQNSSPFQLFAGWCTLVLYLGAATSFGPTLAAMLGSFDADHRVQIRNGNDSLQVVLHHQAGSAQHHHGRMARALTLLAKPASSASPDHVLQFVSAKEFFQTTSRLEISDTSSLQPDSACIGAVMSQPDEVSHLPTPPRPPPDAGGALLGLRSTVLLV
jgi:hypothetical protein